MSSLFVVSDVHGYADDLRHHLHGAGLVDGSGRWSGGDARLYVLGDLLDRGPDGLGAIEFVRALQDQAPEQVQVLMGNHEALALGRARFPKGRINDSWEINGGLQRDQDGLGEHLEWIASLPLMAQVDDYLLLHSDTTEYLSWGSTIDEVNDAVRDQLARAEDEAAHWDVWSRLTSRYDFAVEDGVQSARRMLEMYGGRGIVHGHSIIGSLIDRPSPEVTDPLLYADGLVLAIDGGRYDDGPLLLIELP